MTKCSITVACLVQSLVLCAPAETRANAVIAWNTTAAHAALAACISPIQDPLHESRLYAMMHIAIHDALNAIDRRSRPYAFRARVAPWASPEAAVAAAAREVLVAVIREIPPEFPPPCVDAGLAVVDQEGDWFRWVHYPRLEAEMASYWLAQGDLQQAHRYARASLEHAERTVARKRLVWARKLLGDIAMLDDRPHDAAREFEAALRVLRRYPCPLLEWQVLKSSAATAAVIESDAARDLLLARARSVVRSLADSVRDSQLQRTFLRSRQVRDLLAVSAT